MLEKLMAKSYLYLLKSIPYLLSRPMPTIVSYHKPNFWYQSKNFEDNVFFISEHVEMRQKCWKTDVKELTINFHALPSIEKFAYSKL